MSVNLTNRDRATAAWGAEPPRWVQLLADACDRTSQIGVARQLNRSSGYINRLIHHNYAGSYDEAETLVRATFAAERVTCPLPIGGDMALKTCIRNRRRPKPANWAQLQFARACPTCPHNTDRPIEEEL